MWTPAAVVLAALLAAATVSSTVIGGQKSLKLKTVKQGNGVVQRKLHGRFLHITDLHPDLNYKHGSDPDQKCHRGMGDAGHWGAARSSCDTPWTLVNETFKWIDENLKDQIDFVIWTGDSARHDNDVNIPRSSVEIYDLNERVVDKMVEVFGNSTALTVPIVPTLGNNDIYPHNIMLPGPSSLTHEYVELWKPFIPENQYHIFHKGAYFWQQVVPGKNGHMGDLSEGGLVVFSLNTLYFYDANKAVDGCNTKSEPGYEQMEWLNVQLALMRQRGSKVILIGHVPPAWTDAKMNWEESCWRKYVLWSRQYRDIIVAHLYGHMNLDHFMLLDSDELKPPHLKHPKKNRKKKKKKKGSKSSANRVFDRRRSAGDLCHVEEFSPETDPNLSISSAETYLNSLREALAEMVVPEKGKTIEAKLRGDKWAEKYVLAHVSPSIVPNYFPTLRIMEYNITGLVDSKGMLSVETQTTLGARADDEPTKNNAGKKPDEGAVPDPPSKTAPPGPAYSMQPFTLLSYTQYFLNLTKHNAIFRDKGANDNGSTHVNNELRKRDVETGQGKQSSRIQFEVEYDTKTDEVYKLKDLTVRSYVKLARRIVDASKKKEKKPRGSGIDTTFADDSEVEHIGDLDDTKDDTVNADKKKKKNHRKKKMKNKARDRVWHAFIKRAFVGTVEDDELVNYEVQRTECTEQDS